MGKMGADLLGETKKVASLRHIGIRKTKLISTPQSRAIEEAKASEPIEIGQELEDSNNNQETQADRSSQSIDE
jgi:small subunit ribosomal protein S3Ae